MPSIPQSLLWISLVVLWLFVLVPMLINKRDTVRRTSDVALATRVLNSGEKKSRLIRRGRPAAGHRHDPDWQPEGDEFEEDFLARDEVADYDDAVREARLRTTHTRAVMVVAAVTEETVSEPDYLDVDIVDENSGALPVGSGVQASLFDAAPESIPDEAPEPASREQPVAQFQAEPEPQPEPEPVADAVISEPEVEDFQATDDAQNYGDAENDGEAGDYEYVDDTSGLEAEDEPAIPVAPRSSRQRRMESTTAAAVSARKYRFRRRVLTAMATIMIATAGLAFTVNSSLWWACGATAAVTVLYLAYLRRQTRIEEQVRRRRQQRMARMRAAEFDDLDEFRSEADVPDFPTRLQRPGAVVLDIDDEDPIFEHLDEVAYSRRFEHRDLPRAAGQ